jgi:hypothetical protein
MPLVVSVQDTAEQEVACAVVDVIAAKRILLLHDVDGEQIIDSLRGVCKRSIANRPL